MLVRDRAEVLACFDETASAVFTTLSHLTAGDVDMALDLTVDTYAYLARLAQAASGGIDADLHWMIGAAHSVYGAASHRSGNVEAVASLAPLERVVISLQQTEHWGLDDVAGLVGLTEDGARAIAESALRALGGWDADAAFRSCEVWFDDQMRSEAKTAVAAGTPRLRRGSTTTSKLVMPAWSPVAPLGAGETEVQAPGSAGRAPRSRRVKIVALVGSAAAIAALAVWVRPTVKAPAALTLPSAASSTTVPPSETTTPFTAPTTTTTNAGDASDTTAVPPTIAAAPLTGFLTETLPPGFQAGGGYADAQDVMSRRHWFELWSTEDATRTSGRWFGLVVADQGTTVSGPAPATNAQRIDIGGRPALVLAAPDGVSTLIVQLPGGQHLEIRSFGFELGGLAVLVDSLHLAADNRPSFGPAAESLLAGLSVRTSEPTNQDSPSMQGFNQLETSAFYSSADGRHVISINSSAQSPNDLLASRLLNPPPAGPAGALAPNGVLQLGGLDRVAGTINQADIEPTFDVYSFVQWHLAGSTITVMGDVPVEQLFAAAQGVHRATPDEWVSQSHAVPVITSSGGSSDPSGASTGTIAGRPTIDIASTTTNSGPTWTVTIDRTLVPADGALSLRLTERQEPNQGSTSSATHVESQSWFAVQPDGAQPVREYQAIDATIVLVLLTSPPAGAKIRLTLAAQDPTAAGRVLPLIPVDDAGTVWAAAYSFSEQSAYQVDLMEADGSTMIRTLTP